MDRVEKCPIGTNWRAEPTPGYLSKEDLPAIDSESSAAPSRRRIPPGPTEKYVATQDLLSWMGDQLSRYGDTFSASIYGANAYVIRNPRDVEHVLRHNWRNYVKGQAIKRVALLLGNGLMVSEGEVWKRQRRMIQPAFHRQTISGMTDIIKAGNAQLLKKWEDAAQTDASVNVTLDVSQMVLKIVLMSIFGADYDEAAPHFNLLSEEASRNLEFAQTFRLLGRAVLKIAARRRDENRTSTDILATLMEARDRDSGQAMRDRQLVNEILTLVVAGHETTASTINWIWYLLAQHPEVEQKLWNELARLPESGSVTSEELPQFTYTRQIIDEALRLFPAGWLMTRRALKDDQLGPYFVPAGTEIYIPPYFVQRHPDLWDEPEGFDPDRFAPDRLRDRAPLAMIPFSAGPRNCIGEFFARAQMQVHLIIVAKRLRLRYSGPTSPEFDIGVNLRSKQNFIMKPEIRPDVIPPVENICNGARPLSLFP
jgi:cytochrome P450